MANKTVTVKPSGGTYTTLAAAIAGELIANADLVTMEGILTISIEGDWSSADTTAVVINGFTTSSDYYLKIQTDSSNRALVDNWSTSKYQLSISAATAITINDNHVRIDGLQINIDAPSGTAIGIVIATVAAGSYFEISNCRIRTTDSTGTTRGINSADADATMKVWNCIIYGSGVLMNDGILLAGGIGDIYNSVIYGCVDGIESDAGTNKVYNSAVFNNTDDFDGDTQAFSAIDHCASDDGDGTNPVAPSGGNWANEFVNVAGGDFTLINTGNLYHGGADNPGSGLYSTDIEGDPYNSGAYSIGVDEYAEAGSGIVSILQETYKRRWR